MVENHGKMMENVFSFTVKTLFVVKMIRFLSARFEKRPN